MISMDFIILPYIAQCWYLNMNTRIYSTITKITQFVFHMWYILCSYQNMGKAVPNQVNCFYFINAHSSKNLYLQLTGE